MKIRLEMDTVEGITDFHVEANGEEETKLFEKFEMEQPNLEYDPQFAKIVWDEVRYLIDELYSTKLQMAFLKRDDGAIMDIDIVCGCCGGRASWRDVWEKKCYIEMYLDEYFVKFKGDIEQVRYMAFETHEVIEKANIDNPKNEVFIDIVEKHLDELERYYYIDKHGNLIGDFSRGDKDGNGDNGSEGSQPSSGC